MTDKTLSDALDGLRFALQGSARTVHDVERTKALWNPGAEAWFDDAEDPRLRVLDVDVAYGEFWDGPSGLAGRAIQAVGAKLGRDPGDQGDQGDQGDVVV